MKKKLKNKQGTTLIALIITIAILIIISAATISAFSDSGLIGKAKKAKFYAEMTAINEQKNLSKVINFLDVGNGDTINNGFLDEALTIEQIQKLPNTLMAEIVYTKYRYDGGTVLDTEKIWSKNLHECRGTFLNENNAMALTNSLFYISKASTGKEKEYIYDRDMDICYKIVKSKIGKYTVHSLEFAKFVFDGEYNNVIGTIEMEVGKFTSTSGVEYYEPDLNNFNYSTKIIYYSKDLKNKKEIDIKDYINDGRKNQIEENGITYLFSDYSPTTKRWANIKCTSNGLETNWVWVPRYAYNINTSTKAIKIVFVNTDNKLMDGSDLPSEYTVHEAFSQKEGMKGIWFSKYNPSLKETTGVDKTEPAAPDLSGFDTNATKLIYYTADLKNSIQVDYSSNPSQTIEKDGKTYYFYNYTKKIWANIVCKNPENNLETNWVWIPRYAYKIDTGSTSVILIDENNKPYDTTTYGDSIPEDYTVHEAFTQKEGMKGIWFSKYNPSATDIIPIDKTEPAVPDLSGFDANATKLIYYTADLKNSIQADYSLNPSQTIEKDGKTYYFYNYDEKKWANIVCKNPENNLETNWVWIPRYAYKIDMGTIYVILIDENNKPIDKNKYGDTLPSEYTVHEAFSQKEGMKGIWFSKYNPSEVK